MKALMMFGALALSATPVFAQDMSSREATDSASPVQSSPAQVRLPAVSETSGTTSVMSHHLAHLWESGVLSADTTAITENPETPIRLSSTDQETDLRTEDAEPEYGYGGIYYESEEDVARDAILLPETDTDLEPIEEGEAQSLPK